MEPRPLNKPQRTAPVAPPTSLPPTDRPSWVAPAPAPTSSYPQSFGPAPSPYAGSSGDPLANRGAWYEPATQPPQPGELGYSPGPALKPIDGGRGARLLGPLLALVVLAAVVGAVVFVILKVFDGDDGRPTNANLPSGTTTALAQAAPTEATSAAGEPTQPDAVAGAEQTPAATVTVEATTAGAAVPTDEPTNTPRPTEAPASALSMLPTTSDLPDGFKRTENDKRTIEAVAASFADPADATAKLEDWDWRENAYRTFEIPAEDGPDPNTTTYINISIHRFGEKSAVPKALAYFADSVVAAQGLTEIDSDSIGDESIALSGAPDGSNLVVVYVRYGYYLIRIGGSSPLGDPTQDVVDLAKKIVGE